MENLRIYQLSLDLTASVYNLVRVNRLLFKDFSLNDQLKRASISIVANIAEGYCRTGKESRNYLRIAFGSANEVVALLQIIKKVHAIKTDILQDDFKRLGRQINAYSRKIN